MTHAIVVEAVENPTVVAGPYVNLTLLLTAKMSFGPTLGFYRVDGVGREHYYRFSWAADFNGVRYMLPSEDDPSNIAIALLPSVSPKVSEVTEAVELMLATAELMGYVV